MAAIRFDKIRKSFNRSDVIKSLDLAIHDGEFFTFVGPSGCGKSTILNMIAGLEAPTDGSIYFDDKPVTGLSPKERDIAMVFQSYALYPHMNVYENIAFPLKMKKVDKRVIAEEVARIAGALGIEDLLRRIPKELSGGQRQRVALGRAIIRKPKVFLMDEPLSNLDARLRIEMRGELKRLHQELKITTVYVTHDQAEALSLSDRIAVLSSGEVQQCGTTLDVYRKPSNMFVAGFIGSPAMNFIPALVRKTEPLEIECNGVILSPPVATLPSGSELIVGIRPDDVIVSREKTEGSMTVTVAAAEPAGSLTWVDFVWNGVRMKGNAKIGAEMKAGESAVMTFSKDNVVLFDPASEKRL